MEGILEDPDWNISPQNGFTPRWPGGSAETNTPSTVSLNRALLEYTVDRL
jgi:hypothetical protein